MNRSVLWRAAVIQVVAVAIVSFALAIAFPHDFFEQWGWVAGPAAWLGCAAATARALRLPMTPALIGAAIAGIPSVAFVLLGVHWLGAAVAVALFAFWVARLPRPVASPRG
jgi:hypothetical protein